MGKRALARIDTNSSLATSAIDELALLHLWANEQAEMTVREGQRIDPNTSARMRRDYLDGVLRDVDTCGDDVIAALRRFNG